jgi:hypothetical protein
MNYVYPKLSEHDLGFVRLGGAGLGNILFTWARAAVFARDHGCQMIWPTWPSIKIGPYLRREPDKRFYGDLFQNDGTAIDGIKKWYKLATCNRIKESEKESIGLEDETIVEFTGFEGCFDTILYEYRFIKDLIIHNLNPKNALPLQEDYSSAMAVHVRLGDFSRVTEKEVAEGRHDSALPINWYVEIIKQVRKYAGDTVPVYIFSDGTDEELSPILEMPKVQRKTYGTSIGDILGLSRFPLLIASGSSFSMWARYLGRANCICYLNQRKQQILTPEEPQFEIETAGEIPEEIGEKIRELYKKQEAGKQ